MLNFLPAMKGFITEDKPLTNQRKIWKYIFLKLIVKSFQRPCYVQLDLDILFIKLTAQIGYYI